MDTQFKTKTSKRSAPLPSDSIRKAGRSAFIWVIVFIAFHVYWAFGGTFGFGDAPDAVPKVNSMARWIFAIIVDSMFVVGTIVPLAIYQRWGRWIPAWILSWCCWIGAVILLLRGCSAWLDTFLRGTGLVRNGLTGLTYKQELGVAHPSLYTLVSTSAIDTYFTLGGILFLWAAIVYRRYRQTNVIADSHSHLRTYSKKP